MFATLVPGREEKKRLREESTDEPLGEKNSNNQSLSDGNSNDQNTDGSMAEGIWGEHTAQDEAISVTSPPSPALADAVTVRWLQADLSNSTAPAAVHNEVRGACDYINS